MSEGAAIALALILETSSAGHPREIRMFDPETQTATAGPGWVSTADIPAIEPAWLDEARRKVSALGALPEDWNAHGERPSAAAVGVAARFIEQLASHGRRPHIAPMADGGIEIRLAAVGASARLEIYNDGEVVLVSQSSEGAPAYDSVDPSDAVTRMAELLS